MNKNFRLVSIFILPSIFFIISLITIKDYGVNWDTLQHYVRGQIYYRFLTTGNKINRPKDERNSSYYEKIDLDYAWTEQMTIGHPPLTDIILAASNHLFYQTLHGMEDLFSYQLFIVFMTFVMASIVAFWSYQIYGVFASVISVIVLYTYPLLFAEQHFNMKDPIVAAYFTGFLYFFWLGCIKKRIWAILVTAIFGGLSLGTKFNIVFSIFILIPWMVFYFFAGKNNKKLSVFLMLSLLFVPVISFVIFFVSYPALWGNPVSKVWSVIQYYRQIGGAQCFFKPLSTKWLVLCSDYHTLRLFFTTLPLITVLLLFAGFIKGLKDSIKHSQVTLLWILWLVVTIGRATLPFTSLYGGSLRQIIEFMPAVALLSGAGAMALQNMISRHCISKQCIPFIFIICFIPIVYTMYLLHPNENVYFNALIGGLRGAVTHKYTVATNTYGNGYKQAIDWMNKHIPPESTVYLVQGIGSAVPSYMFRPDIIYKGSAPYLSMYDGNYYMELSEPGMDISAYHNMRYVRTFLNPVYEVKVDGIPIVSVWLNDKKYAKPPYFVDKETEVGSIIVKSNNDELVLKLEDMVPLKRIEMRTDSPLCGQALRGSIIFLSKDVISYEKLLDEVGRFALLSEECGSTAAYGFTGQVAQYIKLYTFENVACDWNTVEFKIYGFVH